MKWHSLRKLQSLVFSPYYYSLIRDPKQWGWLSTDETSLIEQFCQFGIPVQDIEISSGEYKDYFEKAGYSIRYSKYYPHNIVEKSLEHFIAQKILQLNPTDVYVDIASEGSPVPEIYHRLYGCVTYAQDLAYPPGLIGNKIGSDAASLPLPDGSVTKMALHCSFEHFEGDSDTNFIKEAARVLQVGGRVVITPLYLDSRYAIATDPVISRGNRVYLESDALVLAIKGWGNRHGRIYDPLHLSSRVLESAQDLVFKVMRISNLKDISDTAYARFLLVGTRSDNNSKKVRSSDVL